MKSISRPVIDRLPVTSLEEFACRQLDRVRSVFPCLLFPQFVYLLVDSNVPFQFNLVLILSFTLIVISAWALRAGHEATIKRRYI